jgi:hypothetical protein
MYLEIGHILSHFNQNYPAIDPMLLINDPYGTLMYLKVGHNLCHYIHNYPAIQPNAFE